MADNRLWLICKECDDHFAIAKCFTGTGYYTNRTDNVSFNDWLAKHHHEGLDHHIGLEYES
jgi:hypothetical protein